MTDDQAAEQEVAKFLLGSRSVEEGEKIQACTKLAECIDRAHGRKALALGAHAH